MTTEELKIRITADTSGIESSVNKVKKSLGALGGKGTQESAEGVAASMQEVKDAIESLQNLTALDLLTDNLENIHKISQSLSITLKDMKSGFGSMFQDLGQGLGMAMQSLNPKSEMYEMIDWSGFGDGIKGFREISKVTLTEFKEQMALTFARLKTNLASVGTAFKNVFASIVPAGAAAAVIAILGVVAAVVTLVATIKNAINVAKQLKQAVSEANKLNMSVQKYQEWSYVLDQVGVGADKLSDFLKTLADEQNAVRDGSEDIIATYRKLGLTAQQVAAMGHEELFEETVARLQNIEDATERTSLAYRIFGEDAAELNAVLRLTNGETAALASNFVLLGGMASDSLIKKSSTLSASLANLRTAWQGLKNTLAEAVMPAITAVVNWLTKAIAVVNMFLRTIFGFELTPTSSGFEGAAGSVDTYTGSVESATSAVEKLKRTTMGFDELNIVQNPNSSSGSDGGSGGGGGGGGISGGGLGGAALDTDSLGLGKIRDWFEKYKTLIQDITTWSLIGIGIIGAVLCLMGGNWLGAIGFAAMAGIGFAVGSVEGGTFDRLGQTLKGWWEDLKGWFNSKVKPVFTKDYWADKWETITNAAEDKLKPLKNALTTIWDGIKSWFNTNIKPKFTKDYWKEKFDTVRQGAADKLDAAKTAISDKWKAIKDWFDTNVKSKFTKSHWADKFDTVRQGAADKLDSAKKTISDKWTAVKDWFNSNVKSKFTKSYWADKFDTIRQGASSKLDSAKSTITGAWDTVKKWFNNNVKSKFTTSYWKDKFSTIGTGAKSAFNGVIAIVEKAVNNIIKKINTLSWTIPDWVPSVGGKKFGFNFKQVSIPRLATGGIATRSILANIGENGREAVLPLENNTGWMDLLADKIAARQGSAPTKLVLQVDGRELGWTTIENINAITKQTGGLQLAL